MIYEVRNYHIRPESLEAYRHWAKTYAVPHLSKVLDVVGFWIDLAGEPPTVTVTPTDALGSANVAWVLRWKDRAESEATLARVFGGADWAAIFARLPGGLDNYLRMESRWAEALA